MIDRFFRAIRYTLWRRRMRQRVRATCKKYNIKYEVQR